MTGRDIPHAGEKVKNKPAAKTNETNHFLFLLSILPPFSCFKRDCFRYLSILAFCKDHPEPRHRPEQLPPKLKKTKCPRTGMIESLAYSGNEEVNQE
jgi:hypothetical protein